MFDITHLFVETMKDVLHEEEEREINADVWLWHLREAMGDIYANRYKLNDRYPSAFHK
jgi:hypothetical protein